MPTYEYRCPKGHDFERFYKTISSGSVAEVACPECGEVAGRRMSAGAGLMFKGSGFYLTDYGKNAHRGEGTKSGAGGEAGGATPETGKSESREPKGESPKAEGPKAGSPKAESAKAESPKPKAESAAPKAEGPKPKSGKPKSE